MATRELTRTFLSPSTFDEFFKPWNEWFGNSGFLGKTMTVPAVNVTEKNDHYMVALAAPGLDKNDFKINIEGLMLNISSEKEEMKEEKDEKFTRKEYNYSSFTRSFSIPEDVKQDGIDASYENGVLNIRLPKMETNKRNGLNKAIAVK